MIRHNKPQLIFIGLLLIILVQVIYGAPAPAITTEEIEQRQQELEDLERKRRDEQVALERRLNREEALKAELKVLEERLIGLRREQERLGAEIEAVEREIARVEWELADAEEQLRRHEDLLNLRLRAIQQYGVISYIEVLFDSQSFPDFLTRLYNLSIIASNDIRLIEEIQGERDKIQSWKDELQAKKYQIETLRRQVANNEEEMERATRDRLVVLNSLQDEIHLTMVAIADLEDEARALDDMIRQLMAEAASQMTGLDGALAWPIEPPTWVSSGYGWRNDPFSGNRTWHGGIDIAPHHGAANYIIAAAGGQVIYSGWNGGYGNCIMIDHGGGTVTLYAHMSSLNVRKGDMVNRGERIGRAGTTGYSTGVHLHFEVREFNRPPVRQYPGGGADHRYDPSGYF